MDLQYCNGRKRYDFSTDEGFYYPGCDPKYYHINDLSPQAFRRAYVADLFAEDGYSLNVIGKYQMLVPGTHKNKRDAARDLAGKEFLQEQVSPDTYEDRRAFFEAWKYASCCADDCDNICDKCSNKNIQFKSVPTFGLDADVRRYITKYWRYQTASESKEDSNGKDRQLSDREVCNGVIQCEQKPTRKPAKKQKTALCETDNHKADLLRRRPRKMVNG